MSKQFTFEAIGTHFWIEIFDDISDEELEATKGRLELLSSEFNQNHSRFISDSLLSKLNRERTLDNPTPEFRELIMLSKELYTRTEGAFNVLVGHILEARGYDANYSFKAKDTAETLVSCNPLTDIDITENKITITCGNIDNGGYGKGYLIDKIANDLKSHDVKHFLVNGGGDMYATSNHGEAIEIYLEHPTMTNKYFFKTTLLNQGFAASSPFKRQWEDGGKTYSHIIADDKTPELGAFVKAEKAVLADAFSKACLLLSEQDLLRIVRTEPLAFARFNPNTSEFWQTQNFNTV